MGTPTPVTATAIDPNGYRRPSESPDLGGIVAGTWVATAATPQDQGGSYDLTPFALSTSSLVAATSMPSMPPSMSSMPSMSSVPLSSQRSVGTTTSDLQPLTPAPTAVIPALSATNVAKHMSIALYVLATIVHLLM